MILLVVERRRERGQDAAQVVDLAADLYLQLARRDGNLVYSPVSVYVALAMTYAGAGGSTGDRIQ